jgi:hypothetical protein
MANRIHDIVPIQPTPITDGTPVTLRVEYSCEVSNAHLCVSSGSPDFDVTASCHNAPRGSHLVVSLTVTITRKSASTSTGCTLYVQLRMERTVFDTQLEYLTVN